jgi:hypothetical protein
MSEQYVFLKLVTGDQIMAMKESETESTLTIKFPMLIKNHVITQNEVRVSEQVTAGPFTMFAESAYMQINRMHIVIETKLAEQAIPHYLGLVKEHEGIEVGEPEPVSGLIWEDEPEEEIEGIYIEGNDVVH